MTVMLSEKTIQSAHRDNHGTSLDLAWVMTAHVNRSAVDRVGYPIL